jgi:hypothetical protein
MCSWSIATGLLAGFVLTQATGTAEREAAVDLVDEIRERGFHPTTLAGDKNYDTRQCVAQTASAA